MSVSDRILNGEFAYVSVLVDRDKYMRATSKTPFGSEDLVQLVALVTRLFLDTSSGSPAFFESLSGSLASIPFGDGVRVAETARAQQDEP